MHVHHHSGLPPGEHSRQLALLPVLHINVRAPLLANTVLCIWLCINAKHCQIILSHWNSIHRARSLVTRATDAELGGRSLLVSHLSEALALCAQIFTTRACRSSSEIFICKERPLKSYVMIPAAGMLIGSGHMPIVNRLPDVDVDAQSVAAYFSTVCASSIGDNLSHSNKTLHWEGTCTGCAVSVDLKCTRSMSHSYPVNLWGCHLAAQGFWCFPFRLYIAIAVLAVIQERAMSAFSTALSLLHGCAG